MGGWGRKNFPLLNSPLTRFKSTMGGWGPYDRIENEYVFSVSNPQWGDGDTFVFLLWNRPVFVSNPLWGDGDVIKVESTGSTTSFQIHNGGMGTFKFFLRQRDFDLFQIHYGGMGTKGLQIGCARIPAFQIHYGGMGTGLQITA